MNKYVRFYFDISVLYLIPPEPQEKRGTTSGDSWERSYLERPLEDLETKLSKEGLEVAYHDHKSVDQERRLYSLDCTVSALYTFSSTQIVQQKKGKVVYTSFIVKDKPFLKAKAILENKIRDALKNEYVIASISDKYATSRDFVFEVYMLGDLELKHVLSPKEIRDAGGVRDAIKDFNDQVTKALEQNGFIVEPNITMRRPKGNIYKFDLNLSRLFSFSENEVLGDLALMEKDMPLSDAMIIGIDFKDEDLTKHISWARDEIEYCLDNSLEVDAEIIRYTLDFVDYDEELYDYSDDLIM